MENILGYHRKSGTILENAGEFSASYEMARCVVNQACYQWGYGKKNKCFVLFKKTLVD